MIEVGVAPVLSRAADLIVKMGWRQGCRSSSRRVCVEEAIEAAAGGTNALSRRAIAALRRTLRREPYIWNDEGGRTQEEVIAVLRRVAKKKGATPNG